MRPLKLYIPLLAAVILIVSCKSEKQPSTDADTEQQYVENHIDSLVTIGIDTLSFDRKMAVIDSLEQSGEISGVRADNLRGVVYYDLGKPRFEEIYYKRSLEHEVKNDEDRTFRYISAAALISVYMMKSDYDGALRLGLSIIDEMKRTRPGSDMVMAKIYNCIGSAQLSLGRQSDAEASFEQAYDYAMRQAKEKLDRSTQETIANDVCNIAIYYLNAHQYSEVPLWLNRVEELTDRYAKLPGANPDYVDDLRGRIFLYRAVVLENGRCSSEAAHAYNECLNTKFGKSLDGLFDATDYLMPARRYAEAADNFMHLDRMLSEWGIVLSLDNIQQYMFPKFRANAEAGRKDSAIAVGMKILAALDTAIVGQKRSDAAELATIYDTQQKETEIALQQAQIAGKDYEISRQRNIGLLVAIVLLSVFFVVYTRSRRRAAHRLANMRAEQERIESELRIARDIQMSMVPHEFPQLQGLDLYASMTPAKEVGGDLYDYLILGDKLYFCVGDVSGKGVPASLFMAQATRLFRALAKQDMMPATIATRLNDELSESNESGMFVTMFIGLLHISTGHLDFCNAGHNPPVIGGGLTHGEYLKMKSNAPIGLWPGLEYEGEEVGNIKYRALFIYSDGLTEAEDRNQAQFGEDRLLDILQNTRFDSARQVIESLKSEVETHRNGAEPNDDLTMLCLRVN